MAEKQKAPMMARALAAMADMGGYVKDNKANVGRYDYSYEDFAQVDAIITPALAAHGLAYRQCLTIIDGAATIVLLVTLICDLETGESEVLDKRPLFLTADSQANGSAETYARRYALKTAFRLTEADDDGKAAKDAAEGKRAKAEDPLTAAKRRCWEAAKKWAAKEGIAQESAIAGVKKRPDYAETAEFFNLAAEEFEAAL